MSTIVLTEAVQIKAPVIRQSDHVWLTFTPSATATVFPHLTHPDARVLSCERAKFNHAWVEPDNGQTYGTGNYVKGSHHQRKGAAAVSQLVTDGGLGKGKTGEARNVRLRLSDEARNVLSTLTGTVHLFVSGTTLIVTL